MDLVIETVKLVEFNDYIFWKLKCNCSEGLIIIVNILKNYIKTIKL